MRRQPRFGAVAEAKSDQGRRHRPQSASASSPKQQLLNELARARLERRIAAIEKMICWKEGLQQRLWVARMRFEHLALSAHEQTNLEDEVKAFGIVARIVGKRGTI